MTEVLIAGAGPTGLTLAIDLARRGVPHRIIDRAAVTGSRGKGLQPRTLEVFDDLGVIGTIRAVGGPYPPMRAYSGTDVVWEGRMHDEKPPSASVPYPGAVMIPQWRTERILRDRLDELGGRVEPVGLASFEQDDEGVTAVLDDGSRVRAAYLVGADGGRSTVRKTLGVAFLGDTHEDERMLIGDVRATGLDRDHWHIWGDMANHKIRVALCPLAGTDEFQFTAPLAPGDEPELTLATYQKMFDECSGRDDVRLTDLSWASVYRLNIRMVERFRAGRVFLAGDAAHVHSPTGGQGLNTGVQDAYNLGWKLGAVLRDGADPSLLDTYEEERLPVAAGVLGISTALYRKAAEGQADAFKRGEETAQLLLAYPDSPLTGPGGGNRAPDAVLRDRDGVPVRLFDLFRGPHFTVLVFGDHASGGSGLAASVPGAVKVVAIGEGGDLLDPDGEARTAYGLDGPGVVLVRPDGYVACAGDESALRSYRLAARSQ
ncbi:FAD-dependent monooxygenase [Actinomadura fibrosa]|uniref:FAD-dependent monooxygenase n=1 Tax=Actinomadura fibrosa TaxID=111802 RepID=A0ABW2Y0C2_9ACTN|nr:FAD-dependent monooxygenase [Actinomadura fibrosa]